MTSPTSLIRFSGAEPTVRRLYCFPFAGGAAATFRSWPRTMPAGTEIAFLRFPGRDPGSPDPPLTSIAAMVDFSLDVVRADAELSFAFFGHSMGAAVAYEVTSALERAGDPGPDHLFVSARQPPGVAPAGKPVHQLPDGDFLDAIEARYGEISPEVRNEPELLRMYVGILRADVTAFETYRPLSDHRVRCPITALGGRSDQHPRPDELEGWADVSLGPVQTHLFDGGHFYINEQGPAVTAIIGRAWTRTPMGS